MDDMDFDTEDFEGDFEPDLDFMTEHDTAMASAGMGTAEDYGFFGDDDFYGGDF